MPGSSPLESGRHCRELFSAYQEDREGRVWDYLPYGPFDSLAGYTSWVDEAALSNDPLFFAIRDKSSGRAGGVASYLRVKPAQGSIEVGHINLAPALQPDAGGHRRHVPDDEMGVRRRISTIRMEVQRSQHPFAPGCRKAGPVLRRRIPASDHFEGKEPGHGVVRGDRRGMAGA